MNFKFGFHGDQYGHILSFTQICFFKCPVCDFEGQQLLRNQTFFWIWLQFKTQKIHFKRFQPRSFRCLTQFRVLFQTFPAFRRQLAEMLLIVVNRLIKFMQTVTSAENCFHADYGSSGLFFVCRFFLLFCFSENFFSVCCFKNYVSICTSKTKSTHCGTALLTFMGPVCSLTYYLICRHTVIF